MGAPRHHFVHLARPYHGYQAHLRRRLRDRTTACVRRAHRPPLLRRRPLKTYETEPLYGNDRNPCTGSTGLKTSALSPPPIRLRPAVPDPQRRRIHQPRLHDTPRPAAGPQRRPPPPAGEPARLGAHGQTGHAWARGYHRSGYKQSPAGPPAGFLPGFLHPPPPWGRYETPNPQVAARRGVIRRNGFEWNPERPDSPQAPSSSPVQRRGAGEHRSSQPLRYQKLGVRSRAELGAWASSGQTPQHR